MNLKSVKYEYVGDDKFDDVDIVQGYGSVSDTKSGNEVFKAERPTNKVVKVLRLLEGKLMILFAGVLVVTVFSMVKKLSHIPVGQFSATLFFFSALFLTPMYFFNEKTVDFKGAGFYVLVRAGLGGFGGLAKLWAAREMEYGEAVALASLMPVFAALSSRILWKEKISIFTIGSLVLGIVGVILIARPAFLFGQMGADKTKETAQFAFFVPVTGSIIIGIAYSMMRKVGTTTSPVLVGFLVCSFTVPYSTIFMFVTKSTFILPGCFTDRAVMCGGGLLLSFSQLMLNRGLGLEKSGPGALIRNLDMVFAFIIQMLFFNSTPNVFSMLGAALIIGSAILVSANKFCCKNSKYEI